MTTAHARLSAVLVKYAGRGDDKANVKAIAAAAGVSKETVYGVRSGRIEVSAEAFFRILDALPKRAQRQFGYRPLRCPGRAKQCARRLLASATAFCAKLAAVVAKDQPDPRDEADFEYNQIPAMSAELESGVMFNGRN